MDSMYSIYGMYSMYSMNSTYSNVQYVQYVLHVRMYNLTLYLVPSTLYLVSSTNISSELVSLLQHTTWEEIGHGSGY